MTEHGTDAGTPEPQVALSPQIVGNAGLFYCCYRLSRLGWNAMPTARNARGVDLIAYSADALEMRAIQVKALSKRNPVPLGMSLDKIMGDYWVIVTRVGTDRPEAFVMTPAEVAAAAHEGKSKDGKLSCWLQPAQYDRDEYREAWRRIEVRPGRRA